MSLESLMFDTLSPLVDGRVWPDVIPAGNVALPRIVWQQVGGQAVNFLEAAVPDKANARVQVSTWGRTRLQASALAKQAKQKLVEELQLRTTVISEPLSVLEEDNPEAARLYGSIQDFSVWV